MSRVNGGARLSYVRLGLTIHRTTPKAVLCVRTDSDDDAQWVPLTALAYRSEERVESINAFPMDLEDVELVKWKADELGWTP